jgi:hypothetical protein
MEKYINIIFLRMRWALEYIIKYTSKEYTNANKEAFSIPSKLGLVLISEFV